MSARAKLWLQIGGVLFFAGIAIAELTNLKARTFGHPWAPFVFVLASAVMIFEAWRTWRKMKKD